MGKSSKWIKNLLSGKRDRKETKNGRNLQISASSGSDHQPTTRRSIPQTTVPEEKQWWSFHRPSATGQGLQDHSNSVEVIATAPHVMDHHTENDSNKHALAVAAASAIAADAAVAAARAAATLIQLTAAAARRTSAVEEAAAIKIQSAFRAYLARKALNALKGVVKLQALVRGQLVRKQATAAIKCMEAMVNVQTGARAQRLQIIAEKTKSTAQTKFIPRKSAQENKFGNLNQDFTRGLEERIKNLEMDLGDYSPAVTEIRNNHSNNKQFNRTEHINSTQTSSVKQEHQQISLTPSAKTGMSPRTCDQHPDEHSFRAAMSSPHCSSAVSDPARFPLAYLKSECAESLYHKYPFYPKYMANTKSSRAKVRSHSAPKLRSANTLERQVNKQRPSLEGKNIPMAVRMQRSLSHAGSTAQNHQHPWCVKLDSSVVSLKDSECGSTSTVLAPV